MNAQNLDDEGAWVIAGAGVQLAHVGDAKAAAAVARTLYGEASLAEVWEGPFLHQRVDVAAPTQGPRGGPRLGALGAGWNGRLTAFNTF